MENVKVKAREIVEEVVKQFDCYLIDFTLNLQGSRTLLRVVAESDKGIMLSQITDITKAVREHPGLDEILPFGFQIEVSSPGIDFPLKTECDFLRNLDRVVKLRHHLLDIQSPVEGKIVGADESSVTLETSKGIKIFAYSDIEYGKIVLKW